MFRKGSLVLLAGIAILAMAAPVWAANNDDSQTALPLLRTGVDARALGMGNAYVGLANDASAGYWNPAGLYWMNEGQTSLNTMYTAGLSYDRFHNYIGVAHRFQTMALAASWVNAGVRDVQGYDASGNPTTTSGEFDNVFIASMALGTDRAAFGFSLKGYTQNLFSESRNGLGLDAGVQLKLTDMVMLGAAVQDIGGSLGPSNQLPVDWRVGAGIRPAEHFNIGLDVEKVNLNDHMMFHGGAEYGVKFGDDAMAMLRAGVNDSHFTAGLGVRVSKIEANYAFTSESEETLGNSHRVSLLFNF